MAYNSLIASDNFSSGSLAAGWSANFGMSATPVVNVPPFTTEPGALSTNYGQIWTALGVQTNQISEVTLGAGWIQESGTYCNLVVRQQLGVASRYEIDITGGGSVNCTLNVIVSGTPTTLGTVAAQAVAPGDVWTAIADGAFVSVYRNYQRILWVMDTTFTTGYPGYMQYSSVNTTHSQVTAWRGYSCVQQNGIWQKQGVTLAPLAADLASSGSGTYNNGKVLYEGNAQVLSGTVYKMWFSVGGATTGAVAYAESLDGLNWTRRGSNVITGFINPGIIKVGSTYYLFCQPPGGTGNFAQYASSDGVIWTQQSTTILGLGTAGQWDDGFIYFFCPVDIVAGTWRALYTGGHAAGLSSVGLATSPDGLNWTKSGSNPVLSQIGATQQPAWNGFAIANVAGVYYLWCEGLQQGQGGGATTSPVDVIRYSSSNLTSWTKSSNPGLWHAQFSQGVNVGGGQVTPNSIIDVAGRASLYCTNSANETGTPPGYQLSVAQAPAVIAQIVTQPETASSQGATDNFTRAPGGLGPNWTTLGTVNVLAIVSGNVTQATVLSANSGMAYTGVASSADQYSEITIGTLADGSSFMNPVVRGSTSAQTWYECDLKGPTGSLTAGNHMVRLAAGVATSLGASFSFTPHAGDVMRFAAIGSSPVTLLLFQNGFLVWMVQDFGATQVTSGNPGFLQFSSTALANSQVSGFAAGIPNQIPNYQSGGGDLGPGYDFKFKL